MAKMVPQKSVKYTGERKLNKCAHKSSLSFDSYGACGVREVDSLFTYLTAA